VAPSRCLLCRPLLNFSSLSGFHLYLQDIKDAKAYLTKKGFKLDSKQR
jgi:hypothetical protein